MTDRERERSVVDELQRLAHEHPEVPILARNVQGSEISDDPEVDADAPYWLGGISGVMLGRYHSNEDYTIFDDREPTSYAIEENLMAIGFWDWDEGDWTESQMREYYENLPWKPAIIVDIGVANV